MPGMIFQEGETKERPGVYVRIVSGTPLPGLDATRGRVAAVIRAPWGPLEVATPIYGASDIDSTFGTAGQGTTDLLREVLLGNCRDLLAWRMNGTAANAGVVATASLNDMTAVTPIGGANITAKYAGTKGNDVSISVQDDIVSPTTLRNLIVYNQTAQLEVWTFAKGAALPGEFQAAANVIGNNSNWINFAVANAGTNDKIMAVVSMKPLLGGTDPVPAAGDLSRALTAMETQDFGLIVLDTEQVADHGTLDAWIDKVRQGGKRVMGVIGEPSSVAFNTRLNDAALYNNEGLVYVANGFSHAALGVPNSTVVVEGAKAAGRTAGVIAATPLRRSVTNISLPDGLGIVGAMTDSQIKSMLRSGGLLFSIGARKNVKIEQGLTTFTIPDTTRDAGWKKIRRTRTRDALIDNIAYAWDDLIGGVNNDEDGRKLLVGVGMGVITDMIGQGLLRSGTIAEDAGNPPTSDSAWFVCNVVDNDSAEKLYITFIFSA